MKKGALNLESMRDLFSAVKVKVANKDKQRRSS